MGRVDSKQQLVVSLSEGECRDEGDEEEYQGESDSIVGVHNMIIEELFSVNKRGFLYNVYR